MFDLFSIYIYANKTKITRLSEKENCYDSCNKNKNKKKKQKMRELRSRRIIDIKKFDI